MNALPWTLVAVCWLAVIVTAGKCIRAAGGDR